MKRSKAKQATSKGSRLHRRTTPLRGDDDVVTTDDIDWNTALDVEIDPKLAEAIRSRARLMIEPLRSARVRYLAGSMGSKPARRAYVVMPEAHR
jgi:hypothetical protein